MNLHARISMIEAVDPVRTLEINAKDEDGASLLALAAGSFAEDDYPNAATFDSVKVVEMLIDAGADLNARDEDDPIAFYISIGQAF